MPLIEHAFHVVARSVARGPSGYPRVIISTDQRDAEGDIIEQAGLTFRDPLPVLVGHRYKDIPVGVTTRIIRNPRTTEAEFRWIEGDARADMARNAFEQGALCASIGFNPLAPPEHDHPGPPLQVRPGPRVLPGSSSSKCRLHANPAPIVGLQGGNTHATR